MRKIFPFLLVLAVLPVSAHALETEIGFGGFGGFHVGGLMLDLSGVNDYFEPADIPEFDPVNFTAGGEIYGILFERLLLGGSASFAHRKKSGPDLDVDLSAMFLTFDAGIILLDLSGFRVYPVVGLGFGGVDMNIEGDYTTLPLAEQAGVEYVPLGETARGESAGTARLNTNEVVHMSYGAFVAKAALHVEYIHPFAKSENGFALFLTGIRAGAIGDVASAGWRMEGENLKGSEPNFRFNGFFVNLTFAFGGGTPFNPDHRTVAPAPAPVPAPAPPPAPERE